MSCIPVVIPLCQKRVVAPCKGLVTDPLFCTCILAAVRAVGSRPRHRLAAGHPVDHDVQEAAHHQPQNSRRDD